MVKRSLQASLPGIKQAKQAFKCKGWTQENLAGEVGLKTRQPIWRFFTGQPIERHFFLEICLLLGIDWREIAINPPMEFPGPVETTGFTVTDIDILVQQVKLKRQNRIQDRCGTLQLLDISQPARIDDIYIDVNVLEKIPSQQWLELSDLKRFTPNQLERIGSGYEFQSQIEGMKAVNIYSKLRILGKPGAGKTTFLNHVAIQCNRGHFFANRVPIFVSLRDFADESRATGKFSLLSYIGEEFLTSGVSEPSVLEALLLEGRVLLLLDGLDEVLYQERKTITKEIRRFSEKYQQNLFIMTCRTAAQELSVARFTDVEITPFSSDKIPVFVQKWFTALIKMNRYGGTELAALFLENLNLPENMPIRRLVANPLFLHLACWIFLHQQKFPTKRAQFYKQCIDLLLSRWDETRGIERDEMYQSFLLPQKLKLLEQVATATFEQGDYFFEPQTVEQHIRKSLHDLPNVSTEPEELRLESETILKKIALQHGLLSECTRGVFSFSHLTFQEYFTARRIVASHSLQASEQSLERLVDHITDPRWREVFLLTISMLPNADTLVQLMKKQIDAIMAQDPYLQDFLAWVSKQAIAKHHNIQHDWHFSLEQQQLLQGYYDANRLLRDCLNSSCEVAATVRQEIEATLLLPCSNVKYCHP